MDLQNYTLKGVDLAKQVLANGLARGYPIVLKGDPDVDGLMAWFVGAKMLQKAGYSFHSCVNTDRRHGMVEEELVKKERSWGEFDYYIPTEYHQNEIIINVDSSISAEEMLQLTSQGNFVISLDHHEVESNPLFPNQQYWSTKEETSEGIHLIGEAVLINNQYEFEPEELRFWSGTGVVLNALSQILEVEIETEWIAMHGVTLLSDVRDIENPLAREILKVTFETPLLEMPTLRKLTQVCQAEVPTAFQRYPEKLDRTFVDFSLSPYINASYQLNLSEYLFRLCIQTDFFYSLPAKTIRTRILNHMKDYLKVTELENLVILAIDVAEIPETSDSKEYNFKYTSFLGLIANQYLRDLGKTVLIAAVEKGNWLRGSVRGFHSEVEYRDFFEHHGFDAQGHKGAFGLVSVYGSINFMQLDKDIGILEQGATQQASNIHVMSNLLANFDRLKELAYENEFLLSSHYHSISYSGLAYSTFTESAKKRGYEVDGMFVDSFDKDLNPKNALIVPYLYGDELKLILRK